MTSLLLLAVLNQAPTNIPADAEVVYGVMPIATAVPNSDGSKVDLNANMHSVTGTISQRAVSYETLTLYKNQAAVEGTAAIEVEFDSYRSGFGKEITIEGTWSDQPLPKPELKIKYPQGTTTGAYVMRYTLPVKKSATHSLKIKFSLPVGKSGIDREERLVAYRVRDIAQVGALEQFRMALKYSPKEVFVRIGGLPDWGWQIGANGAYLKLDGRKSDQDAVLVFRFYPQTI